MTPRALLLTEPALADLERRTKYLASVRGATFALVWAEALLGWLEDIAETGVQLGTEHPTQKQFRTFAYKRQATILADFQERELRIVRVYFAGQDWSF